MEQNFVFGKNVIDNLLELNPNYIKKLFISKDSKSSNYYVDQAKEKNIKFDLVNKYFFEKNDLSDSVHQGVVADVKEFNYTPFNELNLNNEGKQTILILDRIQDPHNFGAIIRTSAMFGVQAIIVLDHKQAKVNSTVIKTSSGTVFSTKIVKVSNLTNVINVLKKNNYFVYATYLDENTKDMGDVDFANKRAIVIGNEGEGIGEKLAGVSDETFKIDTTTVIDSLNVSVATGIILYHLK